MTYRLGVEVRSDDIAWAAVQSAGAASDRLTVLCSGRVPMAVGLTGARTLLGGVELSSAAPGLVVERVTGFVAHLGDPSPVMVGGTPYGAEALIAVVVASALRTAAEQVGSSADGVALIRADGLDGYRTALLVEAMRAAGVAVGDLVVVDRSVAVAALEQGTLLGPPGGDPAALGDSAAGAAAAGAGAAVGGTAASLLAVASGGAGVAGAAGTAGAAPGAAGFGGASVSGPTSGFTGSSMPTPAAGSAGAPMPAPGAGPAGSAMPVSASGPMGAPLAVPGVGPVGAPLGPSALETAEHASGVGQAVAGKVVRAGGRRFPLLVAATSVTLVVGGIAAIVVRSSSSSPDAVAATTTLSDPVATTAEPASSVVSTQPPAPAPAATDAATTTEPPPTTEQPTTTTAPMMAPPPTAVPDPACPAGTWHGIDGSLQHSYAPFISGESAPDTVFVVSGAVQLVIGSDGTLTITYDNWSLAADSAQEDAHYVLTLQGSETFSVEYRLDGTYGLTQTVPTAATRTITGHVGTNPETTNSSPGGSLLGLTGIYSCAGPDLWMQNGPDSLSTDRGPIFFVRVG